MICSKWPIRMLGSFSIGMFLVSLWPLCSPRFQVLFLTCTLGYCGWLAFWAHGNSDREMVAAFLMISTIIGGVVCLAI